MPIRLQVIPIVKHHTIAAGAIPSHYELHFEPDIEKFKFNARAVIRMRAAKAINSIRLNSKELRIKSATVACAGQKQEANVRHDGDEATFGFQKKVKGDIELAIEYEGLHNDMLYGFYRSSYVYKGRTEHMLSTQFEAPNARAAFPCIDEPEFKATFGVSMLIPRDLEAISNMPIMSARETGLKKLVVFQTTPKMSTYLLYMGVGRFDSLRSSMGRVKFRVFARRGSRKYASLPLEYGKKLLDDLQDYFTIKYPLPKLDLIGVPDFAAGAMENWGAITFRETALLGNEATSLVGKQRIAEVVAHELAHQWFGDLVTMRWWDDMWLNESFATFMAYKSLDRVFPEWKSMLEYYPETIGTAFAADGMKNTHPIRVGVATVGQIEELFDAIGYDKGGSVLLMLEDFVGPELFRKGLARYLKKNSYSNATKKDLWASIASECRAQGNRSPVVRIMEDWISREGYPIVHVKSRNGIFELTQERFTISGNMKGAWKIPVSYCSENGTGKMLMDTEKAAIRDAGSWIKLNCGQAGFYRVDYEPENLAVLGGMIRDKKLGDTDAWGIENDLFASVRSGKKAIGHYLEFVRDFCMDCGYPANASISEHLGWLNIIAHGAPFAHGARELSLAFHRRLLDRLGWEARSGESSIDTKLRSGAIAELGKMGDAGTVTRAESAFEAFERGGSMNPDLKAAVFITVAHNSPDRKKFDRFLGIYKGDGSPEEKIIALRAIGMFGDEALLREGLDLAASEKLRLQDSMAIPGTAAGANPIGKPLYKEWVMRNWKRFMKRYAPSSHMLRACVSAFGTLADRGSKAELEEFFHDRSNMRDDIRVAARQALERISANIEFMERNSD